MGGRGEETGALLWARGRRMLTQGAALRCEHVVNQRGAVHANQHVCLPRRTDVRNQPAAAKRMAAAAGT